MIMYKNKKNKKNIIIILSIIFILLSLSCNIKNIYNLFMEKILLISDKNIIIEDDLLKSYINELEDKIKENNEILNINNCINATVIYRDPEFWYNTLKINKGKDDKIQVGDMIINNTGLIGIVEDVYTNSSKILLLTNINKEKKITVAIKDNENVYGIISKYDKINNLFTISELTKSLEYKDNLNVTTSNFTNTYKDSILIGKVVDIKENSDGLSKIALVKPNANYNNIKYVCVIKK